MTANSKGLDNFAQRHMAGLKTLQTDIKGKRKDRRFIWLIGKLKK
jgi:hypothetical protein